jgi:L-fuconolactonase
VIIDAHHHLWEVARGDYFWMDSIADPGSAPIARDFLLEDYATLARANGITGSVLVQAAQTTAETAWLLEQARASDGLILGVVGWIDMTAVNAREALQQAARNALLRGIRPMLQDIAPDDWVLRPALGPAFEALIELDLAFDVLIRPPQLESAFTLLTRYPQLRAVIDHGAKPQIAQHGPSRCCTRSPPPSKTSRPSLRRQMDPPNTAHLVLAPACFDETAHFSNATR